MRRLSGFSRILFPLLLLAAGCSDKITKNYLVSQTGSIYGRVDPPTGDVTVNAWQAALVSGVATDDEGYFTIEGLKPGLYELRLAWQAGGNRILRDVAVEAGKSTALGEVQLLDLPSPILAVSPHDLQTGVPAGYSRAVAIVSKDYLDEPSLSEGVTIDPVPASSYYWDEVWSPSLTEYRLLTRYRPSTRYTVTIGPKVHTYYGEPLDHAIQFSFTTEAFRHTTTNWANGGEPLPPATSNFLADIIFNDYIDAVSVTGSLIIEPPLPVSLNFGTERRRDRDHIEILLLNPVLEPGIEYRIVLTTGIRSEIGTPLAEPDTLHFLTQPFRIDDVETTNSGSYADSAVLEPGSFSATISLNAPADPDAFNVATSFNPPIPGTWVLYHDTSRNEMRFVAPTAYPLTPDTNYTLTVAGNVPLYRGHTLGGDFIYHFYVRPVRVVSTDPESGETGVAVLAPVKVTFNVAMNIAATSAAFQLEAEPGVQVSGLKSWNSSNTVLTFIPSPGLQYDHIYTATIGTGARTQGGYQLPKPVSFQFRTTGAPVL